MPVEFPVTSKKDISYCHLQARNPLCHSHLHELMDFNGARAHLRYDVEAC